MSPSTPGEVNTHDHNVTPSGEYISRSIIQDAMEPPCELCGRRVQGQFDSPRAWAHEMTCPDYRPHPSSVAGIAAQSKRESEHARHAAQSKGV